MMDIEKYAYGFTFPLLMIGIPTVILLYSCVRHPASGSIHPPLKVFGFSWLSAAVAFATIHSFSTRHIPTRGCVSEDALLCGSSNLLRLRLLHYSHIYFNSSITPMHGALFLDLPFANIGHAGWQNLIWLGLFILVLCYTHTAYMLLSLCLCYSAEQNNSPVLQAATRFGA